MDYSVLSEIDFRNVGSNELKQNSVQTRYREMVEYWIQESLNDVDRSQINNIWDTNVLYLEGHQTPIGSSNNALNQFVLQNWERLNKGSNLRRDEKTGDIYVVDNKLPKMFLSYIGEYTSVKQSIKVVKDDYQRNNTIEKAVQKLYDKVDRDTDSWNKIIIPCIEMMGLYGLAWEKTIFNPAKNKPFGKIESQAIMPQYVLIDPYSEEKYFADSRYRIHVVRLSLDEAKEFLKGYGVNPALVYPDADSRTRLHTSFRTNLRQETRTDFTNIYCVEWRKTYKDDYVKTQTLESLGIEIPIEKEQEDRDYYFHAIYTRGNGIVSHTVNRNTFAFQDYDKFFLTPYYNRQSKTRLHPKSDIEDLKNIQDLINIMKSLVINNARQRSIVRGFIQRKIFDLYGNKDDPEDPNSRSLLQDWGADGGFLPIDSDTDDMRKIIMPYQIEGLPPEVYQFLDLAEKSFQEQSDTQSALVGDYPEAGPLNTSAIMELQAQKRRKLNFKDININWANSQRAKKLYVIFANDFKQEMLMRLLDQPKEKPQAMLLNGIKSFAEYEELLIDLGYVDEQTEMFLKVLQPNDPEFFQKKQMLLKDPMAKYSEENEVHLIFSNKDESGKPLPPYLTYINGVVMINMLSTEDKIDINITLDFDSDREKDTQKVIATNLYERGDLPPEMYLEQLGGWFADNKADISKYIHEKDQAMQIMAELEKRGPEFQAAFQELMARFDQAKAIQPPKNNKKSPNQINAQQ